MKLLKLLVGIMLCGLQINAAAPSTSTLLEVFRYGCCNLKPIFETITGDKKELPPIRIATPGYEQTFNMIFSLDYPICGVTGQDRLMSFLNSFLYPDATEDGFKIREVKPLPESSELGSPKLRILRFGIGCRCFCWKGDAPEKKEVFDIEMLRTFEECFKKFLLNYGTSLKKEPDHIPVVALTFLNYATTELRKDIAIGITYTDMMGKPCDSKTDVYCFHLETICKQLLTEKPIKINDKELGIVGREWLKLLTLEGWATKQGVRYVIPNGCGSDPAIRSAITMLSAIGDWSINSYINNESSVVGMIRTAVKEGLEEGRARAKERTSLALIDMGKDDKFISEATGLSIEDIQQLRKRKPE